PPAERRGCHGVACRGTAPTSGIVVMIPAILPQARVEATAVVSAKASPAVALAWGSAHCIRPIRKQHTPPRQRRLEVHRPQVAYVAAAAGLLAKARRDVLPAFPATGMHRPALSVHPVGEPPLNRGDCMGIQRSQPLVVPTSQPESMRDDQRPAPLRPRATDAAVVSHHVITAILAHARYVGARRGGEALQEYAPR